MIYSNLGTLLRHISIHPSITALFLLHPAIQLIPKHHGFPASPLRRRSVRPTHLSHALVPADHLLPAVVTFANLNNNVPCLYPRRTVSLTSDNPVIQIGRTSKRNTNFEAATTNCWFDSPVMSREHAQLRFDADNQVSLYPCLCLFDHSAYWLSCRNSTFPMPPLYTVHFSTTLP